jgi:hypothetical protein
MEVVHSMTAHVGLVRDLAWSTDDSHLASTGDDGGVFRTIAANTYDAAWSQAASNLAAAASYFRSGFYPRPELPNRDASIRRFLDNLGYIITAIEKEQEQ